MRELALFAGAGGGLLAGHLLGWRTVAAVEIDAYCREVLMRRQRDGLLPVFPIWDDARTFRGEPFRGLVDIVTGGFPCQPFSVAGKRRAEEDPRNLWPDTARIIGEVRPRYALLENVPGLIAHPYFGSILGALAALGYSAEWDVLGAHHIGAPHRRDRLWILAYTEGERVGRGSGGVRQAQRGPGPAESREPVQSGQVANAQGRRFGADRGPSGQSRHPDKRGAGAHVGDAQEFGRDESNGAGEELADADETGRREQCGAEPMGSQQRPAERGRIAWWDRDPAEIPDTEGQPERPGLRTDEPAGKSRGRSGNEHIEGAEGRAESFVGRVADRVAHRVDRLRAIGNGQVSGVVALAWQTLSARAAA